MAAPKGAFVKKRDQAADDIFMERSKVVRIPLHIYRNIMNKWSSGRNRSITRIMFEELDPERASRYPSAYSRWKRRH
jgi:hypothetical protein